MDFAAVRLLRTTLREPGFRLVRSFPVHTADVTDVDVYEMLDAAASGGAVDLKFPVLGQGVHYTVSPIQR